MCNFKIAPCRYITSSVFYPLFCLLTHLRPYVRDLCTMKSQWSSILMPVLSIGSSLLVSLSELQVLKQRTYPLCRSSGDSMGDVDETPFCQILVLSICVTMCSRSARWVNVHSVTLCSWMTAWAADNRGIVRNQGAPWTSHCFGLLLWKLSDFCCYHEQ